VARRPEFQALLAWCELRAGRVGVARELLQTLVERADAGEDEYLRMRVHYWLAEALLALGEKRGIENHLAISLGLVREHSYLHFLRVQAREEAAPLLHALRRGIELEIAAAALVEAGAAAEAPLLEMVADSPTAVGETAIAVLGEVGGLPAQAALAQLARTRRALRPACTTALRHVEARLERGTAAVAETGAGTARLVLFGPPRLEVDGRALPASAWRAQRAFHVLILLSFHPRGISREELIEHFWSGRQAAAGRRNFHPTLSYVRGVLPRGVPAILRESESYRLNPSYPLTCDVWDFEHAMEEARAARGSERRDALERAAAMMNGLLLEGLYENWADALRSRYQDRLEKLMLELGGLRAKSGDFSAALDCFRRAAEMDAYREATRLAVIECHLRLGNRRAALVEFDKLKALLRAELSVAPLPETEAGMRRLLADESIHGWPVSRIPMNGESNGAQEVTAITQGAVKAAAGESPA
jgi:DNA-binding SARP family transcriptional activator